MAGEEVVFGGIKSSTTVLLFPPLYRRYVDRCDDDDHGDGAGDSCGEDDGSHGGDGMNQIADSRTATLRVREYKLFYLNHLP